MTTGAQLAIVAGVLVLGYFLIGKTSGASAPPAPGGPSFTEPGIAPIPLPGQQSPASLYNSLSPGASVDLGGSARPMPSIVVPGIITAQPSALL
jgi:hypothetical protein